MSESFALVYGEDQNAGHVVQAAWPLFFRKVADEATAVLVVLRHDVEQERLDIVIEGLGAKEQFREEA